MGIKHAFTSAKSDGADATLVRPSDWNAGHIVDATTLGITQSYLGYNTAGGSWVNMNGAYAKKITIPMAGCITAIGAYLKGNGTNAGGVAVALLTDSAGAPSKVIARSGSSTDFGSVNTDFGFAITSTGRWIDQPLNAWVETGDYWIVVACGINNGGTQLAYDGSGSDYTNTGVYPFDGDWSAYSSGSNKYSIRASFMASSTGSMATGFIGAKVTHSTTQSSGVLAFNTESYDTNGFHDTVTNNSRLTVPAGLGGKYLLVGWAESGTGGVISIRKNGSANAVAAHNTTYAGTISYIDDAVSGDYYELYKDTGTVSQNTYSPFFAIVKLDAGRVGSGVGARVYNSANISTNNGSWTSLTFDSEKFDTDGFHSTVTNTERLTVPNGLGGIYLISGSVALNSGVAFSLGIFLNNAPGTNAIAEEYVSTGQRHTVTTIYQLAAGDYVTLGAYTASANTALRLDNESPEFSIMRLDSPSSGPLASAAVTRNNSADYTTTSDTFTDVDATNLAHTITTGARRVLVTFAGIAYNATSSAGACFTVAVDGTDAGTGEGLAVSQTNGTGGSGVSFGYITDVISAGSHTFKLRFRRLNSGTAVLLANTTGRPHFAVQELPDSGALAGSGGSTAPVLLGQGGESFGDFSNRIIIPGLSGSADIRVAGTNDDEFDTTDTSDPMTGWTTLGSPTSHNINSTVKSHYYVKKNAASGTAMAGIYKASPSAPFTVTAKLSDCTFVPSGWGKTALFIAEASPGKVEAIELGTYSSNIWRLAVESYTSPTSSASAVVSWQWDNVYAPPMYLRIIVTSTTNVAYYVSRNGLVWKSLTTGRNPSFTVGAVGIAGWPENASVDYEAVWDWIRFS